MSKISEGLKLMGEGFIELAQLMESITPALPTMTAAVSGASTATPVETPKAVAKSDKPKKAAAEKAPEPILEVPADELKVEEKTPEAPAADVDTDLVGMGISELRVIAKDLGLEIVKTKRDQVVALLKTFGAPNAAGIDDSRFALYVTQLRKLK